MSAEMCACECVVTPLDYRCLLGPVYTGVIGCSMTFVSECASLVLDMVCRMRLESAKLSLVRHHLCQRVAPVSVHPVIHRCFHLDV